MENLPKDIKRKIALELSPKDLIELCLTSKNLYKTVCEDEEFWRIKLFHDYPEVKSYFSNLKIKNPKNMYIRIFTELAEEIESLFISRSQYINISNQRTRKQVFNYLYKLYNEIRKHIPFKNKRNLEVFLIKLIEKYPFDESILYDRYKHEYNIRGDLRSLIQSSPLHIYISLFKN